MQRQPTKQLGKLREISAQKLAPGRCQQNDTRRREGFIVKGKRFAMRQIAMHAALQCDIVTRIDSRCCTFLRRQWNRPNNFRRTMPKSPDSFGETPLER